ncbi:MAG TPA: IPTL-CTERM sorting domain-containing protein [Thermodesulfobacteriota bacterium]|nr:IPTL-CTERM sorting domain-containing protein [Thermodesulfobacteriota bacterium]
MRGIRYSFVVALLTFGLLLLALPEKGFSGFDPGPGPGEEGCCQLTDGCIDAIDLPPNAVCLSEFFVENAFCDQETGQCTPIPIVSNIPTLSEWGLIAMAGILGIAGFIIIRRRKAVA